MEAVPTERRTEQPCRLCGGVTVRLFSGAILKRHDVDYFRCDGCNSLQTAQPYWLDEAYSSNSLGSADTGAVIRNLESQAIVYAVSRILRLPTHAAVLDFGGGNGLLCRLLRDIGFDARFVEPYAINDFAQGFQVDGIDRHYDMICSFEVFEHMVAPRDAFAAAFEWKPEVCIIGTGTYRGQGSDWWYLAPEGGQHVFFYSEEAMRQVAAMHAYHYENFDNTHLFTRRPLSRRQRLLLGWVLRAPGSRLARMWLASKAGYYWAVKDAEELSHRGRVRAVTDGDNG